jgi:hypothetical protein
MGNTKKIIKNKKWNKKKAEKVQHNKSLTYQPTPTNDILQSKGIRKVK